MGVATVNRFTCVDIMGKKNRKNQQQQQKKKLCATLTDKNIHRIVEDIWESEKTYRSMAIL